MCVVKSPQKGAAVEARNEQRQIQLAAKRFDGDVRNVAVEACAVRVDTAVLCPTDPCQGLALVLISGVVPGQGTSGQLYAARALRLAYLQGVCLDGVQSYAVPFDFLVNAVPPNPTVPPNPVVPPNPIRVAATAFLAFNTNGTLSAEHAAISVGSVDAPPTVDQ